MTVNLDPLRDHIQLIRWCKTRRAELRELEDNARAEIEATLGDDEEGTLDGEVAVKWTRFKKRQFDQAALKSGEPQIAEEYTKLVEARRFEVIE